MGEKTRPFAQDESTQERKAPKEKREANLPQPYVIRQEVTIKPIIMEENFTEKP